MRGITSVPTEACILAKGTSCVELAPIGVITTIAGQPSTYCVRPIGDEGPAASAWLCDLQDIAFGPDGSLFIADGGNNRVRRVDPNGIIHTVAGGTLAGFSGDTGPAIQAMLNFPSGVDIAADGTLYIADTFNCRVRRVGSDGIITTFAGKGTPGGSCSPVSGTGGLATAAGLGYPGKVRVGRDGSVYILETINAAMFDAFDQTVSSSLWRDRRT